MDGQNNPVSEGEMNTVADVFGRMRDAVINASQLAGEVVTIRSELEGLRREIETLRNTNRWMDGQITELREQRDQARTESHERGQTIHRLESDLSREKDHASSLAYQLDTASKSLASAVTARDDAQLRVMELEDQVKALQAKLDTIREALANDHPPIDQTMPVEEVKPTQEPRIEWVPPNVPAQRSSIY